MRLIKKTFKLIFFLWTIMPFIMAILKLSEENKRKRSK